MNIRRVTSLTLLISFVLCIITSVVLYIAPHGRVAFWSNWHLWGLDKTQWGELHLNLGILLLLAGLLHIYYNWRPITAYLKDKAKQIRVFTADFNIALLLSLIVGVGTYFHIPPMSTIVEFGESIKDSAASVYGEPPYGHAELSSLKTFADRVHLDLSKSMELLRQAGIDFRDHRQTISDIAKNNGITPKQVYEIIKSARNGGDTDGHALLPTVPPPGFGRKRLGEMCAEYGLDTDGMIVFLSDKGIKAMADQRIKEIAKGNNMAPEDIFALISEFARRDMDSGARTGP